ncbi:hypothetical protein GCM10027078_30370 [Nocardioides flavus (ex Wang et al. 2016)]
MVPPIVSGAAVLQQGCCGCDDVVADGGVVVECLHAWIPHSVFEVPAQRPLRGSSPGATRRVQGQQPMLG